MYTHFQQILWQATFPKFWSIQDNTCRLDPWETLGSTLLSFTSSFGSTNQPIFCSGPNAKYHKSCWSSNTCAHSQRSGFAFMTCPNPIAIPPHKLHQLHQNCATELRKGNCISAVPNPLTKLGVLSPIPSKHPPLYHMHQSAPTHLQALKILHCCHGSSLILGDIQISKRGHITLKQSKPTNRFIIYPFFLQPQRFRLPLGGYFETSWVEGQQREGRYTQSWMRRKPGSNGSRLQI